jgi:YD repeat-containing protein
MKKLLTYLFLLIFSSGYAVDLGAGKPGDYLHVHVAPDPVNARNGNFYLPLSDYYQSCFGFPLEVYRSYNSFSTRNGPFGIGWTFNYDIQIAVGEKDALQIIEPDGFVNLYIPVEMADQSSASVIKKVVEARKAEDAKYLNKKEGKGDAFYKDLEQKLQKDPEFLKRQRERYLGVQKTSSASGKYVSFSRGTTYLTKTSDGGYIRSTSTGQDEEYNQNGGIVRISDRNGNELKFNYDKRRRISKVLDSCGNYLDISYGTNDKISKIKDSFMKEMSYLYNKDLQLISSTGTDKTVISYTYDRMIRMDSITFKDDNSKTTITYDPKNGRVIAQDGPGKKRTTYEYSKTAGTISTRIKDNQGENTLYEYIDSENKIRQTDASNVVTTTVLSECCGKPILIESSTGIKDTFEYNKDGNLISKTDAKGSKTFFEYEPRFQQVSEIRDSTGENIRYRYDQNGNLTFAKKTSPDGKTSNFVKLSYELHGKISNIVDDLDQEVKFSYSRIGKPSAIELWKNKKKASEIRVQYTTEGEMYNLQYVPNNPETANQIKETLKNYLMLLKPAGIDFEI